MRRPVAFGWLILGVWGGAIIGDAVAVTAVIHPRLRPFRVVRADFTCLQVNRSVPWIVCCVHSGHSQAGVPKAKALVDLDTSISCLLDSGSPSI